jgi:GNAT superfamily N-acetyltransferase
MQTNTLVFRPGRIEDLPAVKEIAKDVWDGHDYMPYVWNDWLNEPDNLMTVLEIEGQVAGFYSLKLFIGQTDRSSWWQGVRVATAFKRQGLAAQMLEHAIEVSRKHGLDWLRFGTGDTNYIMHHLAERSGFRFVGPYSCLTISEDFEPLEEISEGGQIKVMSPDTDFERVQNFMKNSADWQKGEGLLCDSWAWKKIEPDLIKDFLRKGWVYSYFEDEELKALAFMSRESWSDEEAIFVSWLSGTLTGIKALAQHSQSLLKEAGQPDLKKYLTVMLPHDDERDQLLQNLGYTFDPHEQMRVFELSLS